MNFLPLALSTALIAASAQAAASAAPAVVAQAQPQAQTQAPGTVSGTVLDARRTPLGGATIDATGAGTHTSTTSAGDGTFTLTLGPGLYDITVRKGGFQQAEDANVVVTSGSATPIRVSLIEATVSDLRVIGTVTTGGAASSSITPVSSLGGATLVERQVPSLQEVLPEIPGVTFGARGETTDPYQYFTVRGASIETRVQIDGHPVNTGYGGRFDLSQIDPGVFGGIDVFKGAGIDGANAGESVFGTINLRTRDLRRRTSATLSSASINTARSSLRTPRAAICSIGGSATSSTTTSMESWARRTARPGGTYYRMRASRASACSSLKIRSAIA